ncbi:MAG: hypothetical protein AAF999_06855 [Pseudomonadota bacterium]
MSRLNTSLFAVAFALLTACSETATDPALKATTLDVLGPGVVTRHSNVQLTRDAKAAFARFKDSSESYGAMYVRSNGSGWSWSVAHFTLEDAKAVANTRCNAVTETRCTLYATLAPAEPAPSSAVPAYIEDDFRSAQRNNGAGRAFAVAVNPARQSGWGWNYSTAREASRAAVRSCEEQVIETKKKMEPQIRDALDKAGLFTCRPFATYR